MGAGSTKSRPNVLLYMRCDGLHGEHEQRLTPLCGLLIHRKQWRGA